MCKVFFFVLSKSLKYLSVGNWCMVDAALVFIGCVWVYSFEIHTQVLVTLFLLGVVITQLQNGWEAFRKRLHDEEESVLHQCKVQLRKRRRWK